MPDKRCGTCANWSRLRSSDRGACSVEIDRSQFPTCLIVVPTWVYAGSGITCPCWKERKTK